MWMQTWAQPVCNNDMKVNVLSYVSTVWVLTPDAVLLWQTVVYHFQGRHLLQLPEQVKVWCFYEAIQVNNAKRTFWPSRMCIIWFRVVLVCLLVWTGPKAPPAVQKCYCTSNQSNATPFNYCSYSLWQKLYKNYAVLGGELYRRKFPKN